MGTEVCGRVERLVDALSVEPGSWLKAFLHSTRLQHGMGTDAQEQS